MGEGTRMRMASLEGGIGAAATSSRQAAAGAVSGFVFGAAARSLSQVA